LRRFDRIPRRTGRRSLRSAPRMERDRVGPAHHSSVRSAPRGTTNSFVSVSLCCARLRLRRRRVIVLPREHPFDLPWQVRFVLGVTMRAPPRLSYPWRLWRPHRESDCHRAPAPRAGERKRDGLGHGGIVPSLGRRSTRQSCWTDFSPRRIRPAFGTPIESQRHASCPTLSRSVRNRRCSTILKSGSRNGRVFGSMSCSTL
jgi:hypothetical protein